MIAQIPIAKFDQVEHQGILTNRLYHKSMDYPLVNMKKHSYIGRNMLDPAGNLRCVLPFLFIFIADYPEQQLIACTASNYAPCSTAGPDTLGSSVPQPLREGWKTLDDLRQIEEKLAETNNQNDLEKFKKLAKERHLNGVNRPFWRDWRYADPCLFLAPDLLHQLIKFFSDFFVDKWAKSWLGSEELDRRLKILQPLIGFRHFRNGYSRFKQHTGKEAKDLARVYLGIIYGHKNVTDGILRASRGFLDFLCLCCDYDSHSDATIKYLKEALQRFHDNKQHIADSGVRDGPRQKGKFNIPKLEQMQHVARFIKLLGSIPQFSSEQTERLHIEMAKIPFRASNKRAHAEQMCRYLDRAEKIRLFKALTVWHSTDDGTMLTEVTPAQEQKAFQLLVGLFLPAPVRNVFEKRTAMCSNTTAFQLRKRSNKEASIDEAQALYNLPMFAEDLRNYFLGPRASARTDARLPFQSLDLWYRMRIQLRDPQDPETVLPPVTVIADPEFKGRNWKNEVVTGRHNFVLLHKANNLDKPEVFGVKGMFLFVFLYVLVAYPVD